MSKLDRQANSLLWIVFFVFSFLWILSPSQLFAAVTRSSAPSITYTTIQDALDDAVTGDTITADVGTYAEHLNFSTVITNNVDNLTLEGEETARTIIDGGGTGNVIDLATFSKHITIKKFTIKNGTTGLSIGSTGTSGAINITNNIITENTTGIQCGTSANINITNNSIDQNTTGISCANSTATTVTNSIVSNTTTTGTTGINVANSAIVTYNDVYNNGSNTFVSGTGNITTNPLLVDPTNNDYHLKLNSPAIDAGNPDPAFNDLIDSTRNDIGAYGGPSMDVTPFLVSNLKVVCTSNDCSTINLSWNENQAYNIGDYQVFSGTASGSYGAPISTGGTGICNTSHVCTFPIAFTPAPPPAPPPTAAGQLILDQPTFGDSLLKLHWSLTVTPPANLAGYFVYYGVNQGGPYNGAGSPKDAGNNTSYTLTGLTNGTVYYIIVKAYSAPLFYIAVKAKDTSGNTSDFSTEVTDILTDPKTESTGSSNEVHEFPEALAPFPDLPDQGRCFIATAAYGSPWEPQVKILRSFRDEYLKPYDWGRRFIAWYYHHSPPWAQYLNEHASLKPIVRAALIPAVAVASFFLATTEIERFFILILLILFLIRRALPPPFPPPQGGRAREGVAESKQGRSRG